MPNHVTHLMTVTGPVDDVAAFKKLMIVKEDANAVPWDGAELSLVPQWVDHFDFNQIAPQPEILDRIISPPELGPNGRCMIGGEIVGTEINAKREATPDEQAVIEKVMKSINSNALAKFMHDTMPAWYSWRLANWGTKWNSYDFVERKNEATYGCGFNTA